MAKKPKPPAIDAYELDALPCKLGNVTLGPEKCSISVVIAREVITLKRLEEVVVGARLDAQIVYDPNDAGDVHGQTKFIDTSAAAIKSVVDCPSLNVRPSKYGFRLSFQLGSIDVKNLAVIAQKVGRVSLTRIGDSGGDGQDEEDHDELND